jgi:hypothetical protein
MVDTRSRTSFFFVLKQTQPWLLIINFNSRDTNDLRVEMQESTDGNILKDDVTLVFSYLWKSWG